VNVFYYSEPYLAELVDYAGAPLDWDRLTGRTVVVTGATGLIGSYLVDLLMARNQSVGAEIRVVATGRSEAKLKHRFAHFSDSRNLSLHEVTLQSPLPHGVPADFIAHCASNAQPGVLSRDPVGTLVGTIESTHALLRAVAGGGECRLVFLSSSEVYGAPTAAGPPLREDELGSLDILAPRSSYPMAKRAAETLCVSYQAQYGAWAAMARPAYIFGPTAPAGDDRVIPQFVDSAVRKRVIRIASDGSLRRSYCYVGDCATGLLSILTRGRSGSAYNITDSTAVASIREVAEAVGRLTGAPIEFADPAHATATPVGKHQGILDTAQLAALGWSPRTSLDAGLERTVNMRRCLVATGIEEQR
jgi:nucleoside-diphosphate-sugar epimerase